MTEAQRLPRLVLASGSPRRRELLAGLGVEFDIRPSDIDESPLDGESARACVERLAREKAAHDAGPDELVLAADTVVLIGDRLLGKPADADDARSMLREIGGRTHTVLTGVALHHGASGRTRSCVELSGVRMAQVGEQEIDWYVTTGEPLDKAGSYAIQGRGALFVEAVDGNYTNVVGLPLPATRRLFAELGFELRAWMRDFRA
jgi:septum formation protein